MEKIIDIRFEGDNSLEKGEKINYSRTLNRILTGQKDEIIKSNGFLRVISEKGKAGNISFVSNNADLNKRVSLRLAIL